VNALLVNCARFDVDDCLVITVGILSVAVDILCVQPPSSPPLHKRQQSSKSGKRTSGGQKLSVKSVAEGRSLSKLDTKKGISFVTYDNVLVFSMIQPHIL